MFSPAGQLSSARCQDPTLTLEKPPRSDAVGRQDPTLTLEKPLQSNAVGRQDPTLTLERILQRAGHP